MSDTKSVVQIKWSSTAAFLPNNLTSNDSHVAFIHGGHSQQQVFVMKNKASNFTTPQNAVTTRVQCSSGKHKITEIRHCTAFGSASLVVLYSGTINVFSSDGNTLKTFYNSKDQSPLGQLYSGIAADAKRNLYVGQGTGAIQVFGPNMEP